MYFQVRINRTALKTTGAPKANCDITVFDIVSIEHRVVNSISVVHFLPVPVCFVFCSSLVLR